MKKIMTLAALTGFLLFACVTGGTPSPSAAPTESASTATPVPPVALEPTQPPTSAPTPAVEAASFPDGRAYEWSLVGSGYESPVDIQFAPDGSGRMFIVEQPGRIRVAESIGGGGAPFLDITDRVNSRGNEQGLLGLAFHPRYAENGLFFVNYTDYQSHNVIARFRVAADSGTADAASETILLSIDDPFGNHNGGVLTFGPDGHLYAGLGDGGSANDPFGNGQNPDSLLGKILRLDVDSAEPYVIPIDNPFGRGGGRGEIWAYGLRNPWRMSFDPATGDLYIADVGQGVWEEINHMPANAPGGANFGWNYREGAHAFREDQPAGLTLIDPVTEYSHSEGGCSVTGGYVYRGARYPWLDGVYLFADYCTGLTWSAARNTSGAWEMTERMRVNFQTSSFGQDRAGELYLVGHNDGTIYRLVSTLP